jgi:hypothetical protein
MFRNRDVGLWLSGLELGGRRKTELIFSYFRFCLLGAVTLLPNGNCRLSDALMERISLARND